MAPPDKGGIVWQCDSTTDAGERNQLRTGLSLAFFLFVTTAMVKNYSSSNILVTGYCQTQERMGKLCITMWWKVEKE